MACEGRCMFFLFNTFNNENIIIIIIIVMIMILIIIIIIIKAIFQTEDNTIILPYSYNI